MNYHYVFDVHHWIPFFLILSRNNIDKKPSVRVKNIINLYVETVSFAVFRNMVDNNIKSWTINIILIVFFTYISCDNVNNGDILERCPRIYPRVFNGFAPIGKYEIN